ncbi:miniconductance mechanosensitive channel MscM [Sodalis sp. CWE]|nr:miniconductance mechanosensitive channel MscM [Sodalis sp. CWE]
MLILKIENFQNQKADNNLLTTACHFFKESEKDRILLKDLFISSLRLIDNQFNWLLLKIGNQFIDQLNQLQKEWRLLCIINDSLTSLLSFQQQQAKALKNLNNIEQKNRLFFIQKNVSKIIQKDIELETKQKITELKTRKLNPIQFPEIINSQLKINRELSITLSQQAKRLDFIIGQQRQVSLQTLQVRQALVTLREQAQWLDKSPVLGETLRAQVARLPKVSRSQQLDNDMAQLRVQRLYFEELMNKLAQSLYATYRQDNGLPLSSAQNRILEKQLAIQRNLLNALLTGCDTQILELTKLKVANSQLKEAMNEMQEATNRYLFWVADIIPISFSYPLLVAQDLRRLVTLDTFHQLTNAFSMIISSQETLFLLFGALLLGCFSLSSRHHYYAFLARTSGQVGKVNQDHFSLTLCNALWSALIALPLPILWAVLGHGLRHAWPYSVAVSIGNGFTATIPVLWIFVMCFHFSHPQGLFIIHFGWPKHQVKRVLRYYSLAIGMIIPMIMALIFFDSYSEREFAGTLGRFCFLLLCICLAIVTNSLKRTGLPLYFDKSGSGNNVVNHSLWNLMICAPVIASISSCLGYLTAAKVLLTRLETSLSIWFLLLIIYHIIRRWMFIQRRRIAFERAKQRRAEILAYRARTEEDLPQLQMNNEVAAEVDAKVLDLDTISAQSLQLVRSILALVAVLSVVLLWSELHSAFSFLENITLWDTTSTSHKVDGIQSITFGAVLIAILVFIITAQMVRNLPALLELVLLQHLDLTPGTGYAITTLTKYSLMLIGWLIGFSILGIEWSKLQWLVAALGVGLGFGLQEIFANFISGLMILFERPIRIGDTVTIRNLTGNITRINTRATTITDWDRKEIIVPNKAFITEQFVNWSLSDTLTRVVLNVPAPSNANIEQVTRILVQAAQKCPLVLEFPPPEVFLVDLQKGLPLFELRMHAAEIGHRMPLRHQVHMLILESYHNNGMELPFPPFQLREEQIKVSNIANDFVKSDNGYI